MPFIRPGRASVVAGSGSVDYSAYNYADGAYPTFTTKYGYGNLSDGRVDVRPTQKRIIIDGTTSTNGNYYHVADLGAAKAIFAAGDWVLYPGGQTVTVSANHEWNLSGTNATNMAVVGTFDPADKENDAKYNTLTCTFDCSGLADGADAATLYHATNYLCVKKIKFTGGDYSKTPKTGILTPCTYVIYEECVWVAVFNDTRGDFTHESDAPFSSVSDSFCSLDITFRFCSWRYGNSTTSGRTGNLHVNSSRRVFFEGCIDFHGGWSSNHTRATPAWGDAGWAANPGSGPDIYKHGFYIEEHVDDIRIMDCWTDADGSNPKFTGGNFRVQNYVTTRCPMALIYSAWGGGLSYWPSASTIKIDRHLQIDADDLNTVTPAYRGWGPYYGGQATGTYYKTGLIINNTAPNQSNIYGVRADSNGATIVNTVDIDACVIRNWGGQSSNSTPDAYTTINYTNNVWDIASTGSNTIYSSMPSDYQTRLANTIALTVHTSLRTTFSNWYSGVSVGGSNAATQDNMMIFMCENPRPTAVYSDATVKTWVTLAHYHWRSKLAGVT